MKRLILLTGMVLLGAGIAVAVDRDDSPLTISPSIEFGYLDIPYHTLQFGAETDTFDYVSEGGQEILFPFQRFRIDVGIGERERHHVSLLYQPLTIETESVFEEDRTIDTVTFETGQAVAMTYGFDFWRGTYVYRFVDRDPWEFDAGISFQIRNASIRFQSLSSGSADSDELVVSQDNGPVPVLRARSRYTWDSGLWIEAEADGFYASNAFINGADYPFTGWIWDAALSAGAPLDERAEAYITLRTIGGGAEGTSTDPRDAWTQSRAGGDERYTSNSLVTVAVAAGFRLIF